MFAYRDVRYCGVSLGAGLSRALAASALLAMAGCAANPSATTAYAPRLAQSATSDIEDDGIPAQTPPPAGIRDVAIDPREPFSPNYGGVNPSTVTEQQPTVALSANAPLRPPALPADLPPAFRKKLLVAVDEAN